MCHFGTVVTQKDEKNETFSLTVVKNLDVELSFDTVSVCLSVRS